MTTKRWFAAFLAAAMCFTLLPLSTFAEESNAVTEPNDGKALPLAGYYEGTTMSEETWLGEDAILAGKGGKTGTAYLLWEPAVLGEVTSFTLYFEDCETEEKVVSGSVLTENVAATLEKYGVTLTPALEKGYIKVEAEFEDSKNLEITLISATNEPYSAWLSIDEKQTSVDDDQTDNTENLETGLWYCYVNEEDGVYTEEDRFQNEFSVEVDTNHWVTFYYVNGDTKTRIALEDLNIPDLAEAELLDKRNPYYFNLRLLGLGESEITCDDYPNFSVSVSVVLPWVSFYSNTVRSEETYAGEALTFTGKYTDAAGEAYDIFYLLPDEDWRFTELSLLSDNMDFFEYDIADDGCSIEVHLKEGFADQRYEIRVFMQDIDGNAGGSRMSFQVEDVRPGLRWCWLDRNDQPELNDLRSSMDFSMGDSTMLSIVYDDKVNEPVMVDFDSLSFPDFVKGYKDEDYVRLEFLTVGKGEITSSDYPGCSIPVTATLPDVGFYREPYRSVETYVGETLPYTGKNDVYYILPAEDWTITDVVLDPDENGYDMDFFHFNIMEGGVYVKVTLDEGFEDNWYDTKVYMTRNNGNSTSDRYLGFEVEDTRPSLRYRDVQNDDNDNFFVEEELYSKLAGEIDNNHWIAVYYVDGDKETPIPLSDLKIPGITEAELLDEDNPYYFQLEMNTFGEGRITSKTYPGCSLPVSVNLPWVSFYSSTVRSEETYVSESLTFTGKYTDEAGEAYDIFYILPDEDWRFTQLSLLSDEMDFFDHTIADDGSFIEVMLKEGFTDRNYEIRVYMESINGNSRNNTRMWFKLTDNRPGLRWCWTDRDDRPELDELRSSMDFSMGDDTSLFIVYDDKVTAPVMVDFDSLTFPDFVEAAEQNGYVRLRFKTVGEGKITSSDYPGCSIPVTATLPDVGFFSEPVISVGTYLGDTLAAMPGETAACYLVWDPARIENLDDVLVTLEYGENWDMLLDEVSMNEAEDVLSDYGIELTLNEDHCYIKVEAEIDVRKSLNLMLCDDGSRWGNWLDIDNDINVKIRSWRSDKENPVITYNGEEYSFGIGRIDRESGKFDMFHAGGGFGASTGSMEDWLEETIYLGAMVNYDTKNEDAAPAWIYDCISDVSFELVDYINAHDLNDQARNNAYIDRTYTSLFNGCEMATVDILTVPGGFVESLLRVSFTVTMPGEDPVRCSVDNVVHFAYNQRIHPDMSEFDTAAELNEILSGMDAFLTWIKAQDQKNGTDMYQQYMSNQALNWEATYELHLPAVTYDDLIEVNLSGVEFEISGTTDPDTGKRTTMPGMWLHKNNLFFLSNIDFVAVPGITQEYDGETFTCGVLALGEEIDDSHGDVYTIHGCTFTGFDYGVRNTPYGYACVSGGNHFNNCGVGYLIDCAGKTSGNANDNTSDCIFENCKEAIKILGLPEYITPYDYRIYNCDFLNNNKDIVSELGGRLYCYFNYFGHYTRGAKSLADVTNLAQIQSRPSGIKEKNQATIITNPRYAYPVNAWDTWDINYLTIDNGRHTYIFNGKPGELLLDAEALTAVVEASSQDITINVMSDDEQVQGTWTFDGTED